MNAYRRTPGAVWRRLPMGVVVRVPGIASEALTLTGSVAEMWLALDGPRTHADLRLAATDADATIEMLTVAGLVTVADQLQ